jgi:hypothetical protein
LEKSWLPHVGQKRRVTVFPLSAVLSWRLGVPVIWMASLGKSTFTVPFDEIR